MESNSNFSLYSSGTSNSSSPWGSQENNWEAMSASNYPESEKNQKEKSYSFWELDFQNNGKEAPYTEEEFRGRRNSEELSGGGGYRRQSSWPPARLPRAALPPQAPQAPFWREKPVATSTPLNEELEFAKPTPISTPVPNDFGVTEEQMRVLKSLPIAVVQALLGKKKTEQECRFCKNNGERPSYYRSHALRSGGRVACPVLRRLVCGGCGASGDHAHTARYCPQASPLDRLRSVTMARSMRLASGRKRASPPPAHYVVFGEPSRSALQDSAAYEGYSEPLLDPLWAALEKKLTV